MPAPRLKILFEDNHLLVVDKPAGIATMGAAADEVSLWALARQYIKQRYDKPGNVYLGVVSRIDAPVSGVVVFARTSKAAARLTAQFHGRTVEKIYWAVVEGRPPAHGQWIDQIVKSESQRRMIATDESADGAKEARLSFERLKLLPAGALVEIRLETGRKHQIRLQCSLHGHPIIGDRKYDSSRALAGGIALHCRRLAIDHPISKERMTFESPMPRSWSALGVTQSEER